MWCLASFFNSQDSEFILSLSPRIWDASGALVFCGGLLDAAPKDCFLGVLISVGKNGQYWQWVFLSKLIFHSLSDPCLWNLYVCLCVCLCVCGFVCLQRIRRGGGWLESVYLVWMPLTFWSWDRVCTGNHCLRSSPGWIHTFYWIHVFVNVCKFVCMYVCMLEVLFLG